MPSNQLTEAVAVIKAGGIIAYPTEAVYGFGCDPFNETAVMRLLQIKNRVVEKGLILIAANWQQLEELVAPMSNEILTNIQSTWPGPVTWLFPISDKVPKWLCGKHNTIAVRVTAHPIAKKLCELWGKPLVSTSANREGEIPARDSKTVATLFNRELDLIVSGEVGGLLNPTEIRDAINGKIIRAGE